MNGSKVFKALTALLLVAAVFGGCSESSDVTRDDFSSDLQKRAGEDATGNPIVTDALAECLTTKIFDGFTQHEVNRIYRAATEGELGEAMVKKLKSFNTECLAEGE